MTEIFAADGIATELRHKGRKIGTLWYSHVAGSGDVTLSEEFLEFPPIMKADVLQDILAMLTHEYNEALIQLRSGRGAP